MNPIIMHISAQQDVSYPITIEADLLLNPDKWLAYHWQNQRLVIISDNQVSKIYGEKLSTLLRPANPLLLSFTPGEKTKNHALKQYLEEKMLQQHCDRDTIILALGGGVVGDMAGFIASTYMRGISYIQIPTTLLAMVDSSVGGKTGINTDQGKNLIGTFWQPRHVVIDTQCLKTLPQNHIINGLSEAIKVFISNDRDSFNYVIHHLNAILAKDINVLKNIVERAIKIKVAIVSQDEKEINQRMILNFGHTIGHALEKLSNYTLLHGYAVALGILVEAKISQLLGLLADDEYQLIKSLFLKLNISGCSLKKINSDKLIKATQYDKKIKGNTVRYVLLKKIGQVYNDATHFVHPVLNEVVKQALSDASEV